MYLDALSTEQMALALGTRKPVQVTASHAAPSRPVPAKVSVYGGPIAFGRRTYQGTPEQYREMQAALTSQSSLNQFIAKYPNAVANLRAYQKFSSWFPSNLKF